MKKTPKQVVGDIGEEVARMFLVKRGFSIVAQNYEKPCGEIDIIAEKSGKLHFVEVKTVSRENTINPAEHVTREKLQRLHKTIFEYLRERKVPRETQWQLDVLSIHLNLDTQKAKVDYIENVVRD